MIKENKQNGIVLYIVLLIVSIFMAIVLTLTNVSISQTKISWQAGDSVKAFTAADTGVERALYNIRILDPADFSDISGTLLSNPDYSYSVHTTQIGLSATIKSSGVFRKTRRTIEAKY